MIDPTFLPPIESYRALVAEAAEGITIIDARGTVVFENHAAERLFGWESGVGRSIFEPIHATNLSRLRQAIGDVISVPELRKQLTVRLRHRDGRWLAVRATCHALHRDQSAPLVAIHWIDISEYDILETRLRHAQKLLTLGRMISTVAEDLDVALATIRLHLAALLESRIDELRRFRLQSILRATGAATVVASALRGFSRTAPIAADPVDVNDLLHDVRRLLGDEVWLAVTMTASAGRVLVDRRCLQDAIIDLVRAFHHAMPPDSVVALNSVNPPPVAVPGLPGPQDGAHVVIEVQNTGRGLERDSEWLEPWGVKPASGAIMLSLAILEDAVGYFGGFVEVTSTGHAPTTVRIWLPLQPPNGTTHEPAGSA